jgi:hypothetical protein
VTPGNTRPEASRTTPASVVCALATTGTRRITKRKKGRVISLIETPFFECGTSYTFTFAPPSAVQGAVDAVDAKSSSTTSSSIRVALDSDVVAGEA